MAACLQARQRPAVLWIKQTDFGGPLVCVNLPRLSHRWIFVSLSQGGRARVRRQAPGRREEASQEAAASQACRPSCLSPRPLSLKTQPPACWGSLTAPHHPSEPPRLTSTQAAGREEERGVRTSLVASGGLFQAKCSCFGS